MKLFGNIILLFGLAVLVVGCSKKSNNAPAVESKSGKAIDLATDFLGQDFQDPVPESQSVNEPEAAARVPAKSKGLGSYTIGKSTTYVTGPIDADGHIDYAMASNERLGRGATTENNAAVLIWKAIGPHPDNATQPAKFYELLGVEIPEKGDYFVSLNQYLEKVAKSDQTIAVSLDGLTQLGREAWTANEHPDIDRWLKANEKQLAMIIDATKRTCYYSPTVPPRNDKGSTGLINTLLPGLQITRVLAAALAARAMLSLGQGDHDAAWQDLLACHRLGRLVGQGGLLIEGLVGLSLEQTACKGYLAFLDKAQPDLNRIENCLSDLRKLPLQASIAQKVDISERFTGLDHIMMIDKHGLSYLTKLNGGKGETNPFFDFALDGINWDPALETVNRWFDRMVVVLREKDRGDRVRKMDQFTVDIGALKTKAADPDRLNEMLRAGKDPAKAKGEAIGDILTSLLFPAVFRVQDASDRQAQTFNNVIVAFALARYQRENGRYPDQLQQLVPLYLTQVPKDLFSRAGNPLIYRRYGDGYWFYTVGPNGKNDGGDNDDFGVEMPRPVPR